MADGKIFAAEFALRRNVKALDKILIEDSDDGVVKYAFPPQIAALSGYAYADSIADLPEDPVNKTIGYVVGDKFYIYVGEGGNAKNGLYQEVQGFVGPQGIPGPKGDKGDAGDGAIDEAYLANYLQQNQYQTASDVNSALAIYATQAYVTQEIDKLLGGASGAYDTLKEIEEVLKGNVDSIGDLFDVLDTKWTQDNTLIAHWNEAYSWGNHATAGYVAKTYVDSNFVTLATAQTITGEKNFTGGFKVNGGVLEYNASLGTWVLNGDLLVTGGVSAFSNIEGFTPSTITDAVLIDNVTIKRNSVGALYVASGSDDGGIDEAYLAEYLTTNNYAKKSDINSALTDYATQSWVTGRGYITGITSSMVTNALGYTPYNSSNPAGYITSSGSITGNAATSNRLVEEVVTDLNNATAGRIFTMTSGYGSIDGNKPTDGWVTGLTLQYAQNGIYRRQLAFCDDLYFRRESNAIWDAWRKILDDSNYSDYALPITGGTVNGNVRINKFLAVGASSSSTNTARAQIHLVSSGANPCNLYFGADDTLYWSVTARNAADAGGFNKAFALYDVTNSAYRMMMFPNGNLAIGGTTASEKLHVYGNILATGGITAPTFTGVASNATYWNAPSSIRPTTANVPVVGNTTFSHFLATASMTTGKPSNDGYIIHAEWDTVAGWSAQLFFANGSPDPNNRMQWRAMDAGAWGEWKSVAFIDAGMLKPTQGLQINHIGSNYAEGIRLANRNGTSNTWSEINFGCDPSATTGTHETQWTVGRNGNNYFVIRNNVTDRIQIDLSGNATLTGNFVATGGVTAQNSSDKRLKRNIRKFNARKVLMSLGGVYQYEYVDSEVAKNHIYEGTHYGLIYQHVKGTTLDVMCHEREDGFGTLNYIHPKFISLIAGATMENISEVEKLKRKIRHLENKVKQLENRA